MGCLFGLVSAELVNVPFLVARCTGLVLEAVAFGMTRFPASETFHTAVLIV
jgi:hypothetical protein